MDGLIAPHSHTLRASLAWSAVDDTPPQFPKEQPVFALIRQLSRYILISG